MNRIFDTILILCSVLAISGSVEMRGSIGSENPPPLTNSWPPYGPIRLVDIQEFRKLLENSSPTGGLERIVTIIENGTPTHEDRFSVQRSYFDDRFRWPLQRCLDELEPRLNQPSADLDSDGDVDLDDMGILQRCMSGPTVPKRPGC